MKPLRGYNEASINMGGVPAGGYVIRIQGAEEVQTQSAHYLKIMYDIVEGEYKDYYTRDWKAQGNNPDRKWHGFINVFIPDENSEYYNSNLRRFKTTMWNIEQSNNGYQFNFDERTLKGKICGILYRDEDWTNSQGQVVCTAKPYIIVQADKIRNGEFTVPEKKELAKKDRGTLGMFPKAPENPAGYMPDGFSVIDEAIENDDDLPF